MTDLRLNSGLRLRRSAICVEGVRCEPVRGRCAQRYLALCFARRDPDTNHEGCWVGHGNPIHTNRYLPALVTDQHLLLVGQVVVVQSCSPFPSSSGSRAEFTATRRASSRVSTLAE
jgi:hypothetical protein